MLINIGTRYLANNIMLSHDILCMPRKMYFAWYYKAQCHSRMEHSAYIAGSAIAAECVVEADAGPLNHTHYGTAQIVDVP